MQFEFSDLTPTSPQSLSALASWVMALVWIVYLHLFLSQHKRSSRPMLLIQHAHELNPDALCMFVNMSKETVHLACAIAKVYHEQGCTRHFITDFDRITPDDYDVQKRLKQGPIQSGGYLLLGSFADIVRGQTPDTDTPHASALQNAHSLEICIAVHGPSTHPIGARRLFHIEQTEEGPLIRAQSIHTEQLTRWRDRKTVREWVESRIEPRYRNQSQTDNQEAEES